jgi:hypothetical protein
MEGDMSETKLFLPRKRYGMFAFWVIHTLMLAFFLIAEATGIHFPVGTSLFYFAWIAIWLTHGLTLILLPMRDREAAEGNPAAGRRFWRRLILGAHSALYVAFGPLIIVWWLMSRTPGPLENGEGQGFWIYPVWLMILLAHGAYVMIRDRQQMSAVSGQKRKRAVPRLKRLMEVGSDEVDDWDDDADYMAKNKR